MTADELKKDILGKVAEYYRLVHAPKQDAAFVPGETKVNYAGRVFDEKEMVNLVDSSLEFWLTYGHWSRDFERGLAEYLGVRFALMVNSGSSANLLAFMTLTSPLLGDRRVKRGDEVRFHDQLVNIERKIYLILNKPKDCVTTVEDPQERHTVMEYVKGACKERIYPVGRLDRNTTGVLLLTNDGDLAEKLTHPKFGKKKIYAATLDRDLDEVDEDILRKGITLDNEKIIPDALEFPKDDRIHIGLEIHSGQNRVVRRLFEKIGYRVMQLDRVSFAGLTKKNVPRGKYRFLTPKEVGMLQMGAFE